ncbi:hypothetical protein [Flavobacterium phragmitis]|uniref:MetA-pathway of phenol degradation n=1 Tax=Flavobacterium phragmitis TaxID=739143 RepID=A0A1I1LQY7_9FLAO|nr:hypothetical protein [Flavobacterium phragmitis]SFC75415.1 hypothetical protein SAMN05216297_102156 [Flavobacterium phragmitis]
MKLKYATMCALLIGVWLLPFKTAAQQTDHLADSSSFYLSENNISVQSKADDYLYQRTKPVPPWFARRIKATVGLFIPVNNTTIEVGSQNGTFGTEIDFEDDLGFRKSSSTFLSDIQWRASRRSRFDLSYFHLKRTTSYQLKRDIEFGDHTYPVDASVHSFFETSIYRFSYGYALLLDPKYELGLMIGAHILRSDVGISLAGATAELGYNDGFDFTAPLPDVGIWGGYAFTDKLALTGNVSYLSLKINDISGKIISYNLSVLYQVIPNLELALGYTGLNFKVDAQKERLQGYFKWGYNGPSLTVSYSFGPRHPFQ